jgi:serine-type D-Ala-D-Ala carboxypeptidase (penicillin-binding protein 5/6)
MIFRAEEVEDEAKGSATVQLTPLEDGSNEPERAVDGRAPENTPDGDGTAGDGRRCTTPNGGGDPDGADAPATADGGDADGPAGTNGRSAGRPSREENAPGDGRSSRPEGESADEREAADVTGEPDVKRSGRPESGSARDPRDQNPAPPPATPTPAASAGGRPSASTPSAAPEPGVTGAKPGGEGDAKKADGVRPESGGEAPVDEGPASAGEGPASAAGRNGDTVTLGRRAAGAAAAAAAGAGKDETLTLGRRGRSSEGAAGSSAEGGAGGAGGAAAPEAASSESASSESGAREAGKSSSDESVPTKSSSDEAVSTKSSSGERVSAKPSSDGPVPTKPSSAHAGPAGSASAAKPSLAKPSPAKPSAGAAPAKPAPAKPAPDAFGPAKPAPGKPAPVEPPAPPARPAAAPAKPAAPVEPPAAASGPATVTAPAVSPAPGAPRPQATKEQPAPPVPAAPPEPDNPLKLLADLTNSPPPPQTPLRTAVRRFKIWTPLVVLLLIVFCVVQLVRPLPQPALDLTAASTYAFKGTAPQMPWPDEGQAVVDVEGLGSLGHFGASKPVPIASVTKVMTAYLILKDHPLKPGAKGPLITADAKAQRDYEKGSKGGESVIRVTKGQRIPQKEALQDLLIPSANNVARLLGRWDAGSEQAFAHKMNATARKLGMTHTTYTDPSGLDATTVSTAADQVKLAKAAMLNPVFREIVNTGGYRPAGYSDTVYNNNSKLHTDGIIGIKTGSSTAAGGNLLFAAEKQIGGTKQLIIGAVLSQHGPQILDKALNASQRLAAAAGQALRSMQVVHKGEVVARVDDGLGTTTPVVATKNMTVVGWPGLKVRLNLKPVNGAVPHQAKPGQTVGTLTLGSGPGQVKVPVALKTQLTKPSFGARLMRLA